MKDTMTRSKLIRRSMIALLLGAVMVPYLSSCGSSEPVGTTEGGSTTTKPAVTTTKPGTTTTKPGATTTQPTATEKPSTTTAPSVPDPTTPAAFDPKSIENLLVWYDFSKLPEGEVREIANLAGDNFTAKVTGDDRGATVLAKGIGDLSALSCTKSTSFAVEGSEDLDFHDFTIVAVVLPNSYAENDDQNQIFSKLDSGDPYNHQWYFNINSQGKFNSGWRDATGRYMNPMSITAGITMNEVGLLVSSKSGLTAKLYQNGTEVGSMTSDTDQVALNHAPIYLGSNGSYSQCMDGMIGEIMLIKGGLEGDVLENLQNYLCTKWNISESES